MSADQKPKTLLECLTSPLEHERVWAVAELIYQTDGYFRAIAQAITGLALKVSDDESAMRDFLAVRRNAEEVSAWLCSHHQILCQHVGALSAVKAEAQDAQTQPDQVLH